MSNAYKTRARRRLSDADELALWRLAQYTSRNYSAPLGHIQIHAGWGYAADIYRFCALPLEADWEGWVANTDAITGGTVNVLTPDPTAPDFSLTTPLHKRQTRAWITVPYAPLRPYERRAVTSNELIARFIPAGVADHDSAILRLPDEDVAVGMTPSRTAVQTPWLAQLAATFVSDNELVHVGIPWRPCNPIVVHGYDWRDGWGLVMPIRETPPERPNPNLT